MFKRCIFLFFVFAVFFSCKAGVSLKKNDKVKFDNKSIVKYTNNDSTADSTYYSINYPEITDVGNENVKKIINDEIMTFVLTDEEGTVAKSIDDEIASFFAAYEAFKVEVPDLAYQIWGIEKDIKISSVLNNTLTIDFSVYSNMGGAHPNYYSQYFNYDIRTGTKLSLTDLIAAEKSKDVLVIAEKKFREIKGLTSDQSLEETGFLFENGEFFLSSNFMIKEKSILFYYNTYEIAPYVMGPTEIELTFEELKGIIDLSKL